MSQELRIRNDREKRDQDRLVLIVHNVRSAHNVGALFRTADGAGVRRIFLTGYTPTPPKKNAPYLTSAEKSFKKTALGAEEGISWKKQATLKPIVDRLRAEGFRIIALEQTAGSVGYDTFPYPERVALVVGNEPNGIDTRILRQCDSIVEIPMRGIKNSLNVAVAAGVALYRIRSTMEEKG